jgi:hypothetical protein
MLFHVIVYRAAITGQRLILNEERQIHSNL